jgi:hypothetical protein
MSSQSRLFLQLLAIAFSCISVAGYSVVSYTKKAFEEIQAQQEQAQINEFKQQFVRFGEEVVRRVENIASADATTRMALDLARDKPDRSLYMHDATGAAQYQNLDFLEVTTWDGTIISSAPDYSRVGHTDSTSLKTEWSGSSAFLDKQPLRDGDALLLSAVRTTDVAGKRLYVNGGSRIEEKFLSSSVLPSDMRVLLYRNLRGSTFEPADLLDRNGSVKQSQRFAPIIQQVLTHKQPITQTIRLTDEAASEETFFALPLSGRHNELLGVFLIGSSQRELTRVTQRTEWFAVGFGAAAFVFALPICFWCSLRVSRLHGQTS